MLQRCYSKFQKTYPRNESYQREGVLVCERWILGDSFYSGFACFLQDMGHRSDGRTLDRVDAEGDYTPDNCRWSTNKQQARNRRAS